MPTLRRLVAQTAGGLPRTFWYLWAGTLISRITGFVVIFLAFYLTQTRHFSASFTGLVIGLQGGGSAVGVLVGGVLADRWGRRPTLITAHVGAAAAMVGLGLSGQAWAIAGWATALGVLSNMMRPAFGAMMVDVVPSRDRQRAFALNYWAVNLGFSVAALLAGLVASVGYLLVFVLDAATSLVFALIVYAFVRETRPALAPAVPSAAAAAERADGLHTVLRDRVYLTFVGLNLLTAIVLMQHLAALPMAMQHDGLPPTAYGLVIALNGVLIVVGQFVLTKALGERRRSQVLAGAALVLGAGFGLTAAADAVWLYALCILIWTVGEMAAMPASSAVIADLSLAHLRGRYQSVHSLSYSVAALIAPILGGWVIDRFGDPPLWLGCFVLAAIAAVGHLAAGPARGRRMALLRAVDRPPVGEPEPSRAA